MQAHERRFCGSTEPSAEGKYLGGVNYQERIGR
jgi:hypothetical protein